MNYKFCLITPVKISPLSNPGCIFITDGIEYLFQKAFPGSEFKRVSMFNWTPKHDEAIEWSDAVVVCGNPRYDMGTETDSWLYTGLFDKLIETGKPLIDAWQGSSARHRDNKDPRSDAGELLMRPRNKAMIKRLSKFSAIISRDLRASLVNSAAKLGHALIPCSSWFAYKLYDVPQVEKNKDLVIVYRRPGCGNTVQLLRHLQKTHEVVCTTGFDSTWCKNIHVDHITVFDPKELIALYASARSVISYRLHAAIPAASLGAKVSMVAVDTRAQAAEMFGIHSSWASDGPTCREPTSAFPPDENFTVEKIRKIITL